MLALAGTNGQQPRDTVRFEPKGGGLILGRVVFAGTPPEPVPRAILTLRDRSSGAGWTVLADANGVFEFSRLPAGAFTLTASRAGIPSIAYGAPAPGRPGVPIYLAESESAQPVVVLMHRPAVITGLVVDESGTPVQTTVYALRRVNKSGVRAVEAVAETRSDGAGLYRLYGLASGEYFVRAQSMAAPRTDLIRQSADEIKSVIESGRPTSTSRPVAAVPVYFPSALDLRDAGVVRVGAGQTTAGIDVRLRYASMARVSGSVSDLDGRPASGSIVTMFRVGEEVTPALRPQTSSESGSFEFVALLPGQYEISARSRQPDSNGSVSELFGRSTIEITDRDVADVRILLTKGVAVAGTVEFGSMDGLDLSAQIALDPIVTGHGTAAAVAPTTSRPDGTFAFLNVPPGRYTFSSRNRIGRERWLESATWNGKDVLDLPFDVSSSDLHGLRLLFAERGTRVAGTLEGLTGRFGEDFYVVVFPDQESYWLPNSPRIIAVRATPDGKFSLQDLAPGNYVIGAAVDLEIGDWFDPAFLRQMALVGTRITVGRGEQLSIRLKVGGAS